MKIRIVKNNIIPFDGYLAITVIPWIFCRKELKEVDLNHEMIHVRQQVEMLFIGFALAMALFLFIGWWSFLFIPIFFWLYFIEWVVRLIIYMDKDEAYYNISFEQEAYDHQDEKYYIDVRKHFAWLRYIFKKTYERR